MTPCGGLKALEASQHVIGLKTCGNYHDYIKFDSRKSFRVHTAMSKYHNAGIWSMNYIFIPPRTTKFMEVILVSLRPSVRPSGIPCPLCSTYSSGWIHFIFTHLSKQLQKVCRV